MDKDLNLEKHYEEMFSMFSTYGWEYIVGQAESLVRVYSNLDNIRTADELHFRKGQLDILKWIMSMKDQHDLAWKELNNG